MTASAYIVLAALQEPSDMTVSQKKVYKYLLSFVGDWDRDLASRFLRFVTGGSCVVSGKISIAFNALKDAGRRPTSSTCGLCLMLPTTYTTYPKFKDKFIRCLAADDFTGGKLFWSMDAT